MIFCPKIFFSTDFFWDFGFFFKKFIEISIFLIFQTRFPARAGGRPPEGGWSPSGPPRKSGSRRCRLATLFVYGGTSGRSASRRSFGPTLRAGPSHSTHDVTRRLYNLHVIHDVIQRHRTGSVHSEKIIGDLTPSTNTFVQKGGFLPPNNCTGQDKNRRNEPPRAR